MPSTAGILSSPFPWEEGWSWIQLLSPSDWKCELLECWKEATFIPYPPISLQMGVVSELTLWFPCPSISPCSQGTSSNWCDIWESKHLLIDEQGLLNSEASSHPIFCSVWFLGHWEVQEVITLRDSWEKHRTSSIYIWYSMRPTSLNSTGKKNSRSHITIQSKPHPTTWFITSHKLAQFWELPCH